MLSEAMEGICGPQGSKQIIRKHNFHVIPSIVKRFARSTHKANDTRGIELRIDELALNTAVPTL